MDENKETFHYTYSAKQQEEIKHIRKKYQPPEEDKMEQLRRMDRRVSGTAQARAITLGVIGLLILGTGMSLFMTDLASALGAAAMVIGIPVGILGIVLVALAYPVYNRTLQKQRQRMAPEILRLTDELLK